MSSFTAQVDSLDEYVNIIYIPLKQYADFLQPILQLLCPITPQGSAVNDSLWSLGVDVDESTPWSNQHPFLNISITPVECTIICTKALAEKFFAPAIGRINALCKSEHDRANVAGDDYVVFSVVAGGLDAAQRVLELTSPLAMAGISIFLFTTYFTDYVLVPASAREQVIQALGKRGFVFQKDPVINIDLKGVLQENASNFPLASRLPRQESLPSSEAELEMQTFNLLKGRGIVPEVRRETRLVHCAGRRDSPGRHSPQDFELFIGLMQCLIHQPRFLSLTLTQTEAASLLLQEAALVNFRSEDILLGDKNLVLIPIILNLQSLPIEAPGIICGVAGKLKNISTGKALQSIELSYLSTARTGTVMVEERDLDKIIEALRAGKFGFDVSLDDFND